MIKKILVILMPSMFQLSVYAQQAYRLDLKKSKILWNTGTTVGGHNGYLLFNSGSLNYLVNKEPTSGSFVMNMNSIRSTDHPSAADNKKVDDELRTEQFFNVPKYPISTMIIKKIVRIGSSANFKVSGDLTIKGITKPIEFTSSIKDSDSINVKADVAIHRFKWNIDRQPPNKAWDFMAAVKETMIADEVHITLNLVFTK